MKIPGWYTIASIPLIAGLVYPLFAMPSLVYVREAQIFVVFGSAAWGLLMLGIMTTPVSAFLEAKSSRKQLLYNPMSNRYSRFVAAERRGPLAYVEGGAGYYKISARDVFIEEKSKVPIAIVHDLFGVSMNPRDALLAMRLQELGIDDFVSLVNFYSDYKKEHPGGQEPAVRVGDLDVPLKDVIDGYQGESIGFGQAINYFASNERSDLSEAEIQRRTAAEAIKKAGGMSNDIKWIIIAIAILVIVGALAYVMIQGGGAKTLSDVGSKLLPSGAVNVITNASATAGGTVIK